jgi:hypothetical protein
MLLLVSFLEFHVKKLVKIGLILFPIFDLHLEFMICDFVKNLLQFECVLPEYMHVMFGCLLSKFCL